ncbi:MAG: ribosome maturation factor RimP [Bacillota bacterium]|nr:ribosome maturation factor RimP [Bacillota bacterium]
MQNRMVVSRVYELALPIASELGLSVWDVEFLKEGGAYQLTVYIDKEGPVSINDCEALSRRMDPVLDGKEFDELPSYTFCVSSAGLDRKLTKPGHFEKCLGKMVELKFYKASNGLKTFTGELKSADSDKVTIITENSEKTFKREEIASVRLYIEI